MLPIVAICALYSCLIVVWQVSPAHIVAAAGMLAAVAPRLAQATITKLPMGVAGVGGATSFPLAG